MLKMLSIVLILSGLVIACSDDSSSDGKKPKPSANSPETNPQKPTPGNPVDTNGKTTASCGIGEICIDWANWVEAGVPQIEKDCKDQEGTFARAACPQSGRLGRCVFSQKEGAVYTMHYYDASNDLNSLKMGCDLQKGKFIAN